MVLTLCMARTTVISFLAYNGGSMIDLNSPGNHELSWRRKLALLDVFCNPNPGAVCV